MNRRILTLVAMLGAFSLAACGSADDPRADARGIDSAAFDAIAGDKAEVARLLQRAHEKGTFDDAMATALRDSALAAEVFAMLRDDPRFALGSESAAAPKVAASSGTRGSKAGTTRSSSTTARKGDVLDRAESDVKKVNERLDQATRVKNDAAEAKKKIEGILGR